MGRAASAVRHLFGARRASATEHNRVLVLSMAFESLFKLVAISRWVLVWFGIDLPAATAVAPAADRQLGFAALVMLCALAMFTAAAPVPCRRRRSAATATRTHRALVFPLYMLLDRAASCRLRAPATAWLAPLAASDLYVLLACRSRMETRACVDRVPRGLMRDRMVVVATLALSLMIAITGSPRFACYRLGHGVHGDLRRSARATACRDLLVVLLAWLYPVLFASDALSPTSARFRFRLSAIAPASRRGYRPQLVPRGRRRPRRRTLVWLYALLLPALRRRCGMSTKVRFACAVGPRSSFGLGDGPAQPRGCREPRREWHRAAARRSLAFCACARGADPVRRRSSCAIFVLRFLPQSACTCCSTRPGDRNRTESLIARSTRDGLRHRRVVVAFAHHGRAARTHAN